MPNHIVNIVTFGGDAETVENALRAISGEDSPIDFNRVLPMPKELEGTTSPMPRDTDADTQAAYADRERRFGAPDWYKWSVQFWGTKWGAYEAKRDGNTIRFRTAWSCPMPVLAAISIRWPTLTLRVEYADEDHGQNFGTFTLRHGVPEATPPFLEDGSAEARRFAYRLHELDEATIAEFESDDE